MWMFSPQGFPITLHYIFNTGCYKLCSDGSKHQRTSVNKFVMQTTLSNLRKLTSTHTHGIRLQERSKVGQLIARKVPADCSERKPHKCINWGVQSIFPALTCIGMARYCYCIVMKIAISLLLFSYSRNHPKGVMLVFTAH